MSLNLTDDKSTLVQVMAWCRQATSHYLSQCWSRFLSPYGVTRPYCHPNELITMTSKTWTCTNYAKVGQTLNPVNSLAPVRCGCNFKCTFLTHVVDWILDHILLNFSQINVPEPHWWQVNIGSGNGLVSLSNKPLPGSRLNQMSNGITRPKWVNIQRQHTMADQHFYRLHLQFSFNKIFWISNEISLKCSESLIDKKSTWVTVMAWCQQATSQCLNQCWPSSMMPSGITTSRPQWVWSIHSGLVMPYQSSWMDFTLRLPIGRLKHQMIIILTNPISDIWILRLTWQTWFREDCHMLSFVNEPCHHFSENGLSTFWHQAITLSFRQSDPSAMGTNINEIWIKTHKYSFKKEHLKMWSGSDVCESVRHEYVQTSIEVKQWCHWDMAWNYYKYIPQIDQTVTFNWRWSSSSLDNRGGIYLESIEQDKITF